MREILFRGKRVGDGEWAYGDLLHCDDEAEIYSESVGKNGGYVIPETVGEYTGLTDKNGTKIFEGDILSGVFSNSNAVVEIIAGCWVGYAGKGWTALGYLKNRIEVIGNIQDNPELLKGD